MDNVAHTLVGAAIGRAVGAGRVPRAGLVGAIAANVPDVAELFTVAPWPRAQHLALHRGVTHAILGVVVEILLLTLLATLALRWWAARRAAPAPPALLLLALISAAMVSHPFMDWQGSYGLRPFLPWNGTWYYGDFVAIVDPWYWLVPLIALAWGERRHWIPLAATLAIWLPTTLAVLLIDSVASWIQIGWIVASCVAGFGWLRYWLGPVRAQVGAALAVALLAAYAAAQGVASLPVKHAARDEARRRFGPDATWAALTIPGRPFVWGRLIAGRDSVAGPGWSVPRHLDVPAVQRALRETEGGRAIATFARFLAAEVDSTTQPAQIQLRDVRYDGWAIVTVSAPP